jgi:PAS domain S-box-containing protein
MDFFQLMPRRQMNADKAGSDSHNCRQPIELLRGVRVGIVGGGSFCRKLIEFFLAEALSPHKPVIAGVADINPHAEGFLYAQQLGIFTTTDYSRLYALQGLEVILEITRDRDLAAAIKKTLPQQITLVDHFHARHLWDSLQIGSLRHRTLEAFQQKRNDPQAIEILIRQSFDAFDDIINRRNDRSRKIELELLENERTQSQIIQGSTIPTFVINKHHIVTHWNKALEKLSGRTADEVVGTNRQWAPFWQSERPTMADVILDQIDRLEVQKLYGSQWRESGLIEGAYEAEVFFPKVGEKGKWLWFTAAPIKSPDGTIVGAIETLWDKTEDKRAEEERDRHTQELAALCSIYTALSAPWPIDQRIEAALKEIRRYLKADDTCIFLQENEEDFYLKYHYGRAESSCPKYHCTEAKELIRRVARNGELFLVEALDTLPGPELEFISRLGFQSIAFIPISAKEKKTIGVLQIASHHPKQFAPIERHALDLIGNRLGVAIENAMLQEQNIKSEAKYRSLFNNDPNPIFIISHQSLEILDINERAQECYGYSRHEMQGMSFLSLGEPDDREVQYGFQHLPLGQSILLAKRRHFRKGGRSFYVNISVSHARYGEGDVLIASTADVTESIEKETQLIQASKMTTLGMMAAGMAHEINQPLNVIQICADFFLKILRKGQPVANDDLRTMANDIIANVDRATGIIRHVRHFARQSEVVTSKVNINEPIEDVFKVLGHQIKAHQIELDLDLDCDIPYVMADHNRLEQVFINLVTNAIDAMDEKAETDRFKGMTKQLQIRSYTENGSVVVAVTDNGVGMSSEVKEKLFEPFFTTKKIGKGTGLGVSISYGIIKDYNGSIEIDSQEGRGTTFILRFPALNKDQQR